MKISQLLAGKCKIQKFLKKKLKVMEKLAGTPLTSLNHNSLDVLRELGAGNEFPYKCDLCYNEDGTKKSLSTVMEEWKDLGNGIMGDCYLFYSGFIGRSFFGSIISRFPEASNKEIDSMIHFFMDNRSLFLHPDSMTMMRLAWPGRETFQTFEQEFFTTQYITSKNGDLIKDGLRTMVQDAMTNFHAFNSSNGQFEKVQENISAWLSFHMNLQNAANILKQFSTTFVADFLLPSLLEDDVLGRIFEEFPNILVPEEVIKYLLEGHKFELFKKHPRMLSGLGNYWEFKMDHFKALHNEIDFTSIRRGLYTVPPIQLVSFMKSKHFIITSIITLFVW